MSLARRAVGGRASTASDGLIGEGWSGTDPDGAHVNVVLAQRGHAHRRGAA